MEGFEQNLHIADSAFEGMRHGELVKNITGESNHGKEDDGD